LTSCDQEGTKEKNPDKADEVVSGMIQYDIEYPVLFGNEDDNLIRMFLPKKMEFTYKEDLFKTEIKNGKIFGTSFIGNSSNEEMMAGTNFFDAKNNCNFTKDDKVEYMNSQPDYNIELTDKTKTILGFESKHALAINKNTSDTIDLYYSNEFEIKSPNWFTAFYEIDGVLLEYEIERYGLKMRFTASKIEELDSTAKFNYPTDFKELTFKEYDEKIESYFFEIMK
jgi:hypothetical protein